MNDDIFFLNTLAMIELLDMFLEIANVLMCLCISTELETYVLFDDMCKNMST